MNSSDSSAPKDEDRQQDAQREAAAEAEAERVKAQMQEARHALEAQLDEQRTLLQERELQLLELRQQQLATQSVAGRLPHLEQQLAALQSALAAKDETIAKQDQLIADAAKDHDGHVQQRQLVGQLRAALDEHEQEAIRQQTAQAELQAELQLRLQEVISLQSALEASRAEVADAQTALTDWARLVDQLRLAERAAEAETARLAAENDELEAALQAAQAGYEEAEARSAAVESELRLQASTVQRLQAAAEAAEQAVAQAAAERESQRQQLQRTQDDADRLRLELDVVRQQIEADTALHLEEKQQLRLQLAAFEEQLLSTQSALTAGTDIARMAESRHREQLDALNQQHREALAEAHRWQQTTVEQRALEAINDFIGRYISDTLHPSTADTDNTTVTTATTTTTTTIAAATTNITSSSNEPTLQVVTDDPAEPLLGARVRHELARSIGFLHASVHAKLAHQQASLVSSKDGELQQRVVELEQELACLQQQLSDSEAQQHQQMQLLQERVLAATDSLDSAEQRLADERIRADNLQRTLTAKDAELEARVADVLRLESVVSSTQAELQALVAIRATIEEELVEVKAQLQQQATSKLEEQQQASNVQRLQKLLDEKTEELDRLSDALEAQQDRLTSQWSDVARLQVELDQALADKAEAARSLTQLQETTRHDAQQLFQLRADKASLLEQNARAKHEYADLVAKNLELQENLARQAGHMNHKQKIGVVRALKDEVNALRLENQRLLGGRSQATVHSVSTAVSNSKAQGDDKENTLNGF